MQVLENFRAEILSINALWIQHLTWWTHSQITKPFQVHIKHAGEW